MDKEIRMSPRELLYISSLLDAAEFIGVSDAFYGMDETEIRSEILTLQTSLMNKRYAEMDFEGRFTLSAEIRETVDACADCDTFVVADKHKPGKPRVRELFYAKGGRAVKMKEDIGAYILTSVSDAVGLLEYIMRDIEWQSLQSAPLQRVTIPNAALTAAAQPGSLAPADGVNILACSGCDEISARAILDGLTGRANYYAVVVTIFDGNNKGSHSAALIDAKDGIYKLTPVTGNDEDAVLFDPLTARQAEAVLADVIGSVSMQGSGV